MPVLDPPVIKPRPVYLNLLAIRQPLPAVVSILHRISGALLFLVGIPALLWVTQRALVSPDAWGAMRAAFANPLVKLLALAVAWSYIHHLLAGVRHLLMDLHIGMDLKSARQSSAVVLVLGVLLTLAVAVRLW
jgi:succinate dehydrogenase / fumarate reductase cytochrome b subunit